MRTVALWERLNGAWQVLLAQGQGEDNLIDAGEFDIIISLDQGALTRVEISDGDGPGAWRHDELASSFSYRGEYLQVRLRNTDKDELAVRVDIQAGMEDHGTVFVLYTHEDGRARVSGVVAQGPVAEDTLARMGASPTGPA